jgi:hypothetical protein
MSRFGSWRSRRRNAWSPTVPTEHWPPGPAAGGRSTALLPDGSKHLSDGVVVETHLLARLLGVRLLRVEGTILMAPGHLVSDPGVGHSAAAAPTYVTGRASRNRMAAGARAGDGLAEAARLLESSDASLQSCRARQVTGRLS